MWPARSLGSVRRMNGNGPIVPWRWAIGVAAAALLIAAGTVLLLTVQVRDGGTRSAACGSAWEVIAGRTGWRQWWAQDLADPVSGAQLVRTDRCPGAVNARIVTSGLLAVGAAAAIGACALARRRRPSTARPPGTASRLRLLGMGVTALGSVLTAGGLVGIALLAADPAATLFQYVSRPAVVLVGLLLTLPAILLIVLGCAAMVLAGHLSTGEATDET